MTLKGTTGQKTGVDDLHKKQKNLSRFTKENDVGK
jgi:hypothetical protein